MKLPRLLLFALIVILSACLAPGAATPGPTLVAIRVYYPASLQPWADKLSACARDIPEVGLYLLQSGSLSPTIQANDIVLGLGNIEGANHGEYIAQVGWEQLVVIVNQSNPVSQMSDMDLIQIFSGQKTRWDNADSQAIQVWVLPESEPSSKIFEAALNLSEPLATDTKLAPDPISMLEAISGDETAIGYLPQSFLIANQNPAMKAVKILEIGAAIRHDLYQPVLAYTQKEPSRYGHDLLVCLQNFYAH